MVLFNGKSIVTSIFPNKEKQYRTITTLGACPTLTLIFEGNEDITDLLIYKKYLDDTFPLAKDNIVLQADFCPYGQADRQFGEHIFTFKYFAKLINDADFEAVYIIDPHSNVMCAALDRCVVCRPSADDIRHPEGIDYDFFFYVDNGGEKKYREIYPDKPYRFGNKKRNLDTGEIISYEVIADPDEIKGKNILIVDDLIMGGRSFKEAAKALKDMGAAKVDLYVTHLMPVAQKFFCNKEYKDAGIDNVFSLNTLEMPWYNNGKGWLGMTV